MTTEGLSDKKPDPQRLSTLWTDTVNKLHLMERDVLALIRHPMATEAQRSTASEAYRLMFAEAESIRLELRGMFPIGPSPLRDWPWNKKDL